MLKITLAAMLVFALGGVAGAATLYAGPMNYRTSDSELQCLVQNVSSKNRQVTVSALTSDGLVDQDDEFDLAPLQTRIVSSNVAISCRFEFSGSKKPIRGTACVFEFTGAGCVATEAAR